VYAEQERKMYGEYFRMKTGLVYEGPSQGISGIRQDKKLFGIVTDQPHKETPPGTAAFTAPGSKELSGLSVFHDSGLITIIACSFLKKSIASFWNCSLLPGSPNCLNKSHKIA
jgi:hypothetical protein